MKMNCKRGHEFTEENTYVNRKGHRICRTCESARREWDKENHKDRNRNNAARQRSLHPEVYYARNASLKLDVLSHYGSLGVACCQWEGCEVSDIDVLTLDHVQNDGAKHRLSVASGSSTYRWLKKNGYPLGFQTLCMNHQWKKEMNRKALHRERMILAAKSLKDQSYCEARGITVNHLEQARA